MTTSKRVPVTAEVQVTESNFTVSAAWDESGDEFESDIVSSHLEIENVSRNCAAECFVNGTLTATVPRFGKVLVRANMATDTVLLRKVQFPTDATCVLLVSVYTYPTQLIVGEDAGDGTSSLTWTLPSVAGGQMEAEGQLRWEDLRFPAQGINPAGATSPATVDEVLTSFPGTLLFAGNQENVIAGVAQMPHGWKPGTAIRPHIHWSKPVGSSAAVAWELYYRHIGFPNDVAGDWVGPVAGTLSIGAPETTNAHCITGFGDIDMTGKRESSCLCWQIRRQGGTDADNGTARLYEFDIHYQAEKHGTASEIPSA
jgi:hypothetical protein